MQLSCEHSRNLVVTSCTCKMWHFCYHGMCTVSTVLASNIIVVYSLNFLVSILSLHIFKHYITCDIIFCTGQKVIIHMEPNTVKEYWIFCSTLQKDVTIFMDSCVCFHWVVVQAQALVLQCLAFLRKISHLQRGMKACKLHCM